jgi:peptidase A4-like protein
MAALGLAVGAAQAARSSASDSTTPAMTVMPNWAGYVVTGSATSPVTYSSVTGTWTVPTATCNTPAAAGGFSTVWVGLGGYTTKNQEEVGTDSNCSTKNNPTYYAWFELVPYIAYNVPSNDKVLAGDTMTGTVNILSTTLVQLQIQDQTRNWNFSRNITFSSQDTSTAEWISEAPASCLRFVCNEANLANFGTVTMRSISAVGNGATGALNNPNWTTIPIQLVPSKMSIPTLNPEQTQAPPKAKAASPAGATPGPPSPDGSSFGITWVPVASPGV